MQTKVKTARKIVEIRRKYGFIEEANNDPQVREYLNMAFRAVGSYWKVTGKIHASGMTREEENIIMPDLIGAFPEDDKKTFRKEVEAYFENINTRIPAEGLKLNVSLENPDKPLSETNIPVNPVHYVAWKHALGHLQVAEDKNTADRYDHIKFYVSDKDAEVKAGRKLLTLENKANAEYLQIQTDPARVDQVLTVLGYDLKQFEVGTRSGLLKKEASLVHDASDEINERRLNIFVETVLDKNLKIKYDILNMISADKLSRIGNRILLSESKTVIGNDLLETVYWFLDKKNSGQVSALYVQMGEVGLKPSAKAPLTPKQVTEKPELSGKITTAPIQLKEDLADMADFDVEDKDEKE